jgi:hypothetical protein
MCFHYYYNGTDERGRRTLREGRLSLEDTCIFLGESESRIDWSLDGTRCLARRGGRGGGVDRIVRLPT